MAKLGDEYQVLVGAVEQALDPGAAVRVGVWVVGPDGKRDLDVEVRGTLDGKERFILIECKDWADSVGIAVVDALDSKRRDLSADEAVIYSNSGFTVPALRKAARLGIGMASALKAGSNLVRPAIYREFIAKRLSVERVRCTLYPSPGVAPNLPEAWELSRLTYDGRHVLNWLSSLTAALLSEHEPSGTWRFACTFLPSPLWEYDGAHAEVGALRLDLDCSRAWVTQNARQDVTLGLYDHIRKVITIPDKQWFSLGTVDMEAWEPYEGEPERHALQPGSFAFHLKLLNPLPAASDTEAPSLDELVVQRDFQCLDAP